MGNRVRVSSPHYLCHSFLLRQRSSPAPVLDPFHGLQSFRNCSSTGPFPQGCKSCQQSCSSRQGGQLSLQATGAARRRLQGGLPTGLQPCFRHSPAPAWGSFTGCRGTRACGKDPCRKSSWRNNCLPWEGPHTGAGRESVKFFPMEEATYTTWELTAASIPHPPAMLVGEGRES